MGEPDEEKVDIAIDGFFLAIGHTPNSEIFKEYIELDEIGFIKPATPPPKRTWRACSPAATWLIPCTNRPSPLPGPVAAPP